MMKTHSYVVALAATAWLGCQAQVEEAAVRDSELRGNEQELIGGTLASQGQFPYQARLMAGGSVLCGGSLIHPRWVLTAASCLNIYNPGDIQVILGDLLVNQAEPTEQVHSVSSFVFHPDFQFVSYRPTNDVALLRLSTPATLNSAVQTIALQSAPASNTLHTVSGWGQTTPPTSVSTSNSLRYVSLPVLSNTSCLGAVERPLEPGELCVGYSDGSKGCCNGDPGNPIVTQGSPPQQVGIVSWGYCLSYTVAASVSPYLSWIESQVNCDPCPMSNSIYDSVNCYRGTPPAGTSPFIYDGNLYYTALPGNQCPMAGSWYDGANCYAGTPPAGTSPFIYNGNLYYTPVCVP